MAKKTPDASKELERKNQKANKIFDDFIDTTNDKRSMIQQSAQEAKIALRSITRSERQSANELAKIKTGVNKEITAAKKSALAATTKVKKEMSDAFDEVDGIRSETRKSYNRFKKTYDAAISGERGIIARKHDIAARHDRIKEAHEEIDSINQTARNHLADIGVARVESLESEKKAAGVRDRAEEIRAAIEDTFQITVDSAMGGALNARKREIQKALNAWATAFGTSIVVLIGAIGLLIYISLNSDPNVNLLEAVTNRLVYLTPLLLVIVMTYRQYSHERRLLEEYAFKATMAQSLRNYAVLLSDNYGDVAKSKERILDFLLKSMTNIYDRSTLDNTSSFFYQFIVGNKHMGAQATVQEGASKTEQITSKKVETKNKKVVETQ